MQSNIKPTATTSAQPRRSIFLPNNFVAQSDFLSGFEIHLASHFGMCFGVRDALSLAEKTAKEGNVTILGELVHNEVVRKRLRTAGASEGDLFGERAATPEVLVTAHGASDFQKERWASKGHLVRDATCPLVKKAHTALATLVAEGCAPVVIGQAGHVEVLGLIGDFPEAQVVMSEDNIKALAPQKIFGVVSQTTQPVGRVHELVVLIRQHHPTSEVRFRDTVCQPTKNRQRALQELAQKVDLVIVVGGSNSNNSRQLAETARKLGCRAHRISTADELDPRWLAGASKIGVTAGTSTLASCVEKVTARLETLGGKVAQ
ncbi:4-hydroxy-3-methylbut-2-enyl diphosphate reductase [bacterium]|nr:4-hydroxy-3-methylbut-2-enyl diphosphate reductase [Akkermansiaceae bacterium]MDB4522343.1 4-hydroxy-3-methylbut-2-enyl diphosphate reductase [bacterium]MDB4275703.1 4-hydroxy-3-methylbut-2-enyl diphosphate reductase [Akkermansiaceae bacterium]MDB4304291.1 4-hydroxy-3-methylbut-2-enyl diphosphate reductase [Akkermansiaceae bacterium]MDB4507045.1 4-hydroxy-3-methylbut-2-enyl diphosphate reductase [Akkermansiaceae bacterium]